MNTGFYQNLIANGYLLFVGNVGFGLDFPSFLTSSVKFCNLLPRKKLSFLQGTTHTFTLLV
jgi:hypothetical protein